MTVPISNGDPLGHTPNPTIGMRAIGRYWPVAATVSVAAIIRSFSWLNCDDSWLLTLGEQLLAGARPYVDFTEPNPPASILMYIPAILIGRMLGIAPETVVTILIFAAALLSLWLTGRILSRAGLIQPFAMPALFALGCLFFLILPGDAFAQREHVALLAILPILAVYAAHASDAESEPWIAALAGIGGGIAIVIKPHFALALVLPFFFVVWRRRTERKNVVATIFSPENLAAALVVLAYAVLLFWRFSDYFRYSLPMVLALYVPLKHTLFYMIDSPPVLLSAMAIVVSMGLGMREFRAPAVVVFSLAVFGFLIALVIQGKGWPYQGYPAIALSLFVLAALLVRRLCGFLSVSGTEKPANVDAAFGVALFTGIYALASIWFLVEPSRAELILEVARLAPVHPKLVTFSEGPELAFPLTRKLHAIPLGRAPFQWISQNADGLLATEQLDPVTRNEIYEYGRQDRAELVNTIRIGRPDVILIGGKGEEMWAFSDPQIAAALQAYRKAETVYGVEIWLPRLAPREN